MTENSGDSPNHAHEELPSGKTIVREFDDGGQLVSEMHYYPELEIGITLQFDAGLKKSEMYFVKQRLVSRDRYEKAREKYADMPAADSGLEDIGGEIAKAARAEQRQRARAAKDRAPDPVRAAKIDSFCETMLRGVNCADAVEWIKLDKHNLGEMSPQQSRKLVAKLMRLGAKRIHACEIDEYDDGLENTGHLVLELPIGVDERKGVLREIHRLANERGYEGDLDDGQRYAYVKLD